MTDRCEKVAAQVRQRIAGETIPDRIVSLTDPDARPIRKGKIGKPTEFGYVSQICEITEHTRPGRAGIDRAGLAPGSAIRAENTLLPETISGARPAWESDHGRSPSDGGFNVSPTNETLELAELGPERVFIAGRQEPASRHTKRRLAALPNRRGGPRSATSNAATG